MSDQKYVNYYIEHAVGIAHDYLNTILQLKTQLRMSNDAVEEKSGIINSLQSELDSYKSRLEETTNQNIHLKAAEEQLHALQNKVSHMDTLLAQVADMKRMIKERDAEIEALRAPVINTKKKPVKSEPTVLPNKPNEDF